MYIDMMELFARHATSRRLVAKTWKYILILAPTEQFDGHIFNEYHHAIRVAILNQFIFTVFSTSNLG